jgi:hypothetical protein
MSIRQLPPPSKAFALHRPVVGIAAVIKRSTAQQMSQEKRGPCRHGLTLESAGDAMAKRRQ